MLTINSIVFLVVICQARSASSQSNHHDRDRFSLQDNQSYQNGANPHQLYRRQTTRLHLNQRSDLDFFNMSRFNISGRIHELTSSLGFDQIGGLMGRRRSDNMEESAKCDSRQETSSFYFFSRGNTGNQFEAKLTRYSSSEFNQMNFQPKKRTYFIIHGWYGCTMNSDYYQILYKDHLLSSNEANVFVVDWSHHAHDISYTRSVNNMKYTAEDIFEFLKNLEKAFPDFKRNKIYIVGFSLGAHVAGQLGRLLDGQATQITGLDPAGVQTDDLHPRYKLTPDDAKYVLALHTNIKNYGTKMNVAHHDIFINGGLEQPACKNKRFAAASCNHRMAPTYLLTDPGQCVPIAHLCQGWNKFLAGHCGFCRANSTDCIPMTGQIEDSFYKSKSFNFARSAQRTRDVPWSSKPKDRRYYAITSAEEPYCVFIYQVIVKFADDFKPSTYEYWSAKARFNNGDEIPLSNFNKLNFKGLTFDGTISGSNVFTALLVVDSNQASYNSMPQKVSSVTLNMSGSDKQVEVYINFMSSLSYQTRKENSGRIKNVDWNLVDNPVVMKTSEQK